MRGLKKLHPRLPMYLTRKEPMYVYSVHRHECTKMQKLEKPHIDDKTTSAQMHKSTKVQKQNPKTRCPKRLAAGQTRAHR